MRKLIPDAPPPLLPSPPQPPPEKLSSSDPLKEESFLYPTVPIPDSPFDLATLSLVSLLLVLSLISLSFVFHLRLRSRRSRHLQNFNTLCSIRTLLVFFVSAWAINEVIRLPFFYRRYLGRLLPYLTVSHEDTLCKIQVVLSLGFFEPGFLITLFFLLNVSIKKRSLQDDWTVPYIIFSCFPVFLLQILFVLPSPLKSLLPNVFHTSSVLTVGASGQKELVCACPLSNTIVFAGFGVVYSQGFLFSYLRIVSLVINKSTRGRLHVLSFTVLVALPLQALLLACTSFWRPGTAAYDGIMLGTFICVLSCAAAGEGIMVIKPISDALSAGDECLGRNSPPTEKSERRPEEVNRKAASQ
ncbi:uncharacterized protein LOC127797735 [Diospyros lotus]|uniref:uncharacterized protein LOC127797735 n=1 Tax=Diospyros lotus TaxID=55363 RepID=UPI00224D149F|nr:uncharacterized protein LOC127797735 [Diospyros lotus]XP_052186830.1 uncharacterized protein LOC127797735 [Diospyros lotus]